MYKQLFDAGVDRRHTNCLKWDGMGDAELLPLWVADMDFRAPECVQQALNKLVAHGVYGYSLEDPDEKQALIDWMRVRHGVRVEAEQILSSPGVVDSLHLLVSAFAKKGDRVAVQPPVYGPFFHAVKNSGCELFENPLIQTCDGWKMDYDGLEAGFRSGVKWMLLCNPHNPVGRVYTKEELVTLVSLADAYGVTIIADEIHADIEMPGHKHVCLLSLTDRAVSLISATKTFNLAALRYSTILFGTQALKKTAQDYWTGIGVGGGNLFGAAAQTAAYRGGAAWLDALIEYIHANYTYARARIEVELPRARVSDLQGTYLMWVDMRTFGMRAEKLQAFLREKAKLFLTGGEFFGAQGEGFVRVNLAAPRSTIEQAMDRFISALSSL